MTGGAIGSSSDAREWGGRLCCPCRQPADTPPRHTRSRKRSLPPPFLLHSTAVAVAGADYAIVAASTRLSTGYSILTRDASKFMKL